MLGLEDLFSFRHGYNSSTAEGREFGIERWAYASQVRAHLVRLIHRLSAEFPNRLITVRPHPSESARLYRQVFADASNVNIDRGNSVVSAILACDTMIHTACTTLELRLRWQAR